MTSVIITDDEPMNIRMTEFILRKYGYSTISTRSGEECLAAAAKGADLILLDVLMPDMDGLQTFERLRASAPGIPVVFLTSAEDADTVARIQETGAGVLSKPFRPEQLLEAVRNALSGA